MGECIDGLKITTVQSNEMEVNPDLPSDNIPKI